MSTNTHRLIEGGNEFLPFAESRLKALKATGLKYAAASYYIDGVEIRVRLAGSEAFIHITATGEILLRMDSGIVDSLNIAPMNPSTYLPGKLYRTDKTQAYIAGMAPVAGSKFPGWIYNYGKDVTPGSQVVGTAKFATTGEARTKSRVKAEDPDLEPQCCSPARVFPTEPTDPVTWTLDPQDVNLYFKKALTTLVPASIFTGRTRLFIQAWYGRALYEYDDEGNYKLINALRPFSLVVDTSAAPAVMVTPYRRKGDTAAYDDVMVDTGSGVYLDPNTGKHWLLVIYADLNVYAFPLLAEPEVEKLRKYIKTVNNKTPLTQFSLEDRERLETYILGRSLPDVKNGQRVCSVEGGRFSMGYGWHWNWDGTAAAIVTNENGRDSAYNTWIDSTRRQLSVSLTTTVVKENGVDVTKYTWSGTCTTLERDMRWKAYRAYWVFAEPNFATYQHDKIHDQRTAILDGEAYDAPFYAFYRRNELIVCRATVNFEGGLRTRTIEGTVDVGSAYGSTIGELRSLGLAGCSVTDNPDEPKHPVITVTIGAETFGPIMTVYQTTRYERKITQKTIAGEWSAGFGYGGAYYGPPQDGGYYAFVGDPTGLLNGIETGYGQVGPLYPGVVNTEYSLANVKFDFITVNKFVEYVGGIDVVVPYYDSQAILVNAGKAVSTTGFGNQQHMTGYGGMARNQFSKQGNAAYYIRNLWYPLAGYTVESEEPYTEPFLTVPVFSKCMYIGGVNVPADKDKFNGLHDNSSDVIESNIFLAWSGCIQGEGAVVMTNGKTETRGMPSGLNLPAFCGYV